MLFLQVERQQELLEKSAAAYLQMGEKLDNLLDRGHALEATVQARPLLNRQIESVNAELLKNKVRI